MEYSVFNYTDMIYASRETLASEEDGKEFIRLFRDRFKAQGYYRTNNWDMINPEDIDLEVIPANANPFTYRQKHEEAQV